MEAAEGAYRLPDLVAAFLQEAGLGAPTRTEPLRGGLISTVSRLTTASGVTLILKEEPSAPAGMFEREREGLSTLRTAGELMVPRVYLAGDGLLLLEDLGSRPPQKGYWEEFGRRLALQHRHGSPRYGFSCDNYLGRPPQRNPWTDDGHEFFARHRILRYLEEPRCRELLSTRELERTARFAERLKELIPAQPPALLHGDLWSANMMVGPRGEPAVIDPAVYFGWPEAELSMVRQYPGVPEELFDAYGEVIALEPGWQERLEILTIRELLAMIAHVGDAYGAVEKLRSLLQRYG